MFLCVDLEYCKLVSEVIKKVIKIKFTDRDIRTLPITIPGVVMVDDAFDI